MLLIMILAMRKPLRFRRTDLLEQRWSHLSTKLLPCLWFTYSVFVMVFRLIFWILETAVSCSQCIQQGGVWDVENFMVYCSILSSVCVPAVCLVISISILSIFQIKMICSWFHSIRESAMALNSLFPDGWFALGAAALKVSSILFLCQIELNPLHLRVQEKSIGC